LPDIEAFVELQDVLGLIGPITIDDKEIDVVANATVVQLGSDDLVVEEMEIKRVVIDGEVVDKYCIDNKLWHKIEDVVAEKAVELALRTSEKYWDYRTT